MPTTVNIVKYFFRKEFVPDNDDYMRRIILLAYRTARDKEVYPKAVFVRSAVHDTTKINGKVVKDPKGNHVTFSYKTEDHLGRATHVACHGYVEDPLSLEFREATGADEKRDSVRLGSGKDAWPDATEL